MKLVGRKLLVSRHTKGMKWHSYQDGSDKYDCGKSAGFPIFTTFKDLSNEICKTCLKGV